MKLKTIIYLSLLTVIPVLIALAAIKTGNSLLYIAVGCYYAGFVMARLHLLIFLPIPLFFCLWFWYVYGFSPSHIISVCTFALLAGVIVCRAYAAFMAYVRKVLPEEELNDEYNAKIAIMNKKIEEYQRNHPNEKITHELVEKIRTDVFFQ
jgi:hypothetical protein